MARFLLRLQGIPTLPRETPPAPSVLDLRPRKRHERSPNRPENAQKPALQAFSTGGALCRYAAGIARAVGHPDTFGTVELDIPPIGRLSSTVTNRGQSASTFAESGAKSFRISGLTWLGLDGSASPCEDAWLARNLRYWRFWESACWHGRCNRGRRPVAALACQAAANATKHSELDILDPI